MFGRDQPLAKTKRVLGRDGRRNPAVIVDVLISAVLLLAAPTFLRSVSGFALRHSNSKEYSNRSSKLKGILPRNKFLYSKWAQNACLVLTVVTLLGSVFFSPIYISPVASAGEPPGSMNAERMANSASLPFILNAGQIDERVKYYANVFAGKVFVTEQGLTYSFVQGGHEALEIGEARSSAQSAVIEERFLNANPLLPSGVDTNAAVVNYFVGDQSDWKTNIPTFNKVSFGQVWNDIDVDLVAANDNVEKIFTVAPGADLKEIQIAVEGVTGISINNQGELVLGTELGEVSLTKPAAFQEIGMTGSAVEVSYVVIDDAKYGFAIGAGYDPHYPLIIDPLLASTYIGGVDDEGSSGLSGTAFDHDVGIVFDSFGNVFIAGLTRGTADDYPATVGPYGAPSGALPDVVVSKFNSDLSSLLASTVIGGGARDKALAIAIDSANNIYVTGVTNSTDFPTTFGAFNETYGGLSDIFVSKLPNNLSSLDASTFIGGNDLELATAITINATGAVYVVGFSWSPNYPTTLGAYDTVNNLVGGAAAIVTSLDPDLTTITGSTFLGGSNDSVGMGVAISSDGNVYVTGLTLATNFPIVGGYDTSKSGANQHDTFIAAFDSDLTDLLSSTYHGNGAIGGEHTTPFGIALDPSNSVYIAGYTHSAGFPTTTGAYDETPEVGSDDAYVSVLDSSLGTLGASTVIGGASDERIGGLALTDSGVYVIAFGGSYPTTPGAFDEGANEAYVSKVSLDLTTLLASTSIGGSNTDLLEGIGISSGDVYVTGFTRSTNYPTTAGAYDTTKAGASGSFDFIISKLTADLSADSTPPVITSISDSPDPFSPNGDTVGDTTTVTFTSDEPGTFTLQILDAALTGGQNITGAMVAGVNNVVWDGSGFCCTTVPDGTYQYLIEADDLAGNRGFGGLPLGSFTITVDTTNIPQISLESVSNVSPKFDVDEVTASGLVINDLPGDYVEVSWGDGEVTQFTPIAGAWGPVSHIYGSAAIGQNTIQPFLFDSVGNLLAVGSFAFVTVSPHDTTFLMNDIGSPATDTPLTVSGFLLDADTGAQLPEGQTITFVGTGASGLPGVTTGGITINDPPGVTIESCSTCIPDFEGATENMVLRLNEGGMLTFPADTQSVQLEIQDTGTDVFTFEVTEFGNPTPFTTDSFGSDPDQTNLFISAPNGIASVELISTTGSTVGISSITTSNPLNTPQEMIHADLENLGEGTYGPNLTLESGAFFARATAVNAAQTGLEVQAQYEGTPLYAASISASQVYDVVDRTWGAAGDPQSFNVDSGTGINTIKCATDADGDGLCSTWDSTGIITYSGATYNLCDFECPDGESQKDVYVEIDSMTSHVPPAAAITNVINAFAAVPNGALPAPQLGSGITLHIDLDNTLTHSNLIEVWADSNGSPDTAQDDFEDIKANNFGTSTERSDGLLAANNALKAKAEVYHYAISVHGIGSVCDPTTPSGIGETPGNDFVLSLGCGFAENNSGHSGSEGDQNEFEGTLMHELGHNLNLGHGGPKEYRTLPSGNSLGGSAAYAVTDNSGVTRAFTITGLKVLTDQARSGSVIIPVNVFTADPGLTTVTSVTQSGDGSAIAINTITSFVSGTGNSRLVTLRVTWTTSAASDATTGNLGTFTVNLSIGNTAVTLPTPTTPAVGPKLKINVGSNADLNCKVNYQSVMSYTRQFDNYLGASYVLDFSRSAITPAITESSLNAESGFFTGGGSAGSKVVNAYASGGGRAYRVSTYPDVDWNGNNAISGSSAQDSNNFGITGCGASANQVQRGYDDWANVQLDFKEGIGSFDGSYSDPRQLQELTGEINDEIIVQVDASTTMTTANPPGGFYSTPQSVELTADGVATIHYTTDGTTPDENSPVYSGQIPISTATELRFFSISDDSGNPEQLRLEVYNFDDMTPPEITVIGDIEDGEQFFFGSVPPEPTCTATDPGSGVNSDGCVVTGYGTAVGSHTLVFTAEDNAGNVATVEIDYTVGAWTLLGFYSPTDMPPIVNTVIAGRTVPLKFEVFAGSIELTDVAVVDALKSFKVSCDPQAPADPVEESLAPPGGTVLRYEDGEFIYNWKTPKTKACYDVVLTLDDGSSIMAQFKTT